MNPYDLPDNVIARIRQPISVIPFAAIVKGLCKAAKADGLECFFSMQQGTPNYIEIITAPIQPKKKAEKITSLD